MKHEMNLNNEPFNKIDNGSKIIELRLFDEKRKELKLGDTIQFINNDTKQTLQVKILGLLNFPNFETLINYMPIEYFGHRDKQITLDGVTKIYTIERQKENGVLGILLKKL